MITNLWYRVEGDDEKTIVPAPYSGSTDISLDSISDECAKHLQLNSERWNKFDFTKYPLDIEFGFNDEDGSYGEYDATIEVEFEESTISAYLYTSYSMHKGAAELLEKFSDRAEKVGLVWHDDEGCFVDSFYLDMLPCSEFFGQKVYLSDGIYIRPSHYDLSEIEQVILEREALDQETP